MNTAGRLLWPCITALVALTTIGAVAQERPDRTRPPALGPAPGLTVPSIQKRALSNGIPVWVVESREVPLVQVNLLVLGGSGDDPVGKFGVASLTAGMLDEGAGNRSSLQIADEVEFLGATLAATSSFDASAVRLNVPVARLDAALNVMADVAIRPTFPETDLERVRRERLTSLLQARDDPESIVPLAFQRLVFGATHRYGTSATGSEASVARLTRDDLLAFHRQWYQPSSSRFVVVGNISADAAVAQLQRAFGAWTGPAAVARTRVSEAPQIASTRIFIVDHPDAAQSQIRIGNVGVSRAAPDFFALEVLNAILGGSFTSRLNQNLREEHQYTYGAASRFDMRLSAGPFVAAAGVQTDKTAEALREFMKELTAMSAPVPADELARARNYLALGFPADFETTRDLAVRLEELIIYGLPDDYHSRYVANIQAVTVGEVQAAARAHILTNRLAIVIVGDRKTIEPGIRALNIAPVQTMTVEEALGL
ncbi:MAG: pitrilysin family protein [Vicinamibacterales bacterium]